MIRRSLGQNTLELAFAQALSFALPLALVPHLTRTLGAEAFGVYQYSLALAQICLVITDFGFPLVGTKLIASGLSKIDINRLIGAIAASKLALTMLCVIGLSIYIACEKSFKGHEQAALWITGTVLAQAFAPTFIFLGLERPRYLFIYIVVPRIILVAAAYTFIASQSDLALMFKLYAISSIVSTGIGMTLLARMGYYPARFDFELLRRIVRESGSYFISRIAAATYTTGGTILVGAAAGAAQAGIYGVADQIYRAVQGVIQPVSQALFPYMVRTKNFKTYWHIFTISCVGLMFVIALGYVLRWELIAFVAGVQFEESVNVFVIFLAITVVTIPSVLLGYPYFGGVGRPELVNSTVNRGVFIFLFLSVFALLAGVVTPITIALILLATEVGVFAMRIAAARKIAS